MSARSSISSSESAAGLRRFRREMGAFAAIQVAIFAVVWVLNPGPRNDFFEAAPDKHRMLEQHPPPRILIVGGSSVAFGFDGARLEEVTGRRPVNLGLHANFGADFLLNEAAFCARPGDAILLSLEYEHFAGDQTDPTLWQLLGARAASARHVSFRQWRRMLDQGLLSIRLLTKRVLDKKRRAPLPGYARAGVNEYGDVVGHHDAKRRYTPDWDAPPSPFSSGAVEGFAEQLADFAMDQRRRGVHVLLAYPPLPPVDFDRMRPLIDAVDGALAQHPAIRRLGGPEDSILPLDHFYDTYYHLTGEGQRAATERLAPLLRDALQE